MFNKLWIANTMESNNANFNNSIGSVSNNSVVIHPKKELQTISFQDINNVSFKRKTSFAKASFFFCIASLLFIGQFFMQEMAAVVFMILNILVILFGLQGYAYYLGNYVIAMALKNDTIINILIPFNKTKEGKDLFDHISLKLKE